MRLFLLLLMAGLALVGGLGWWLVTAVDAATLAGVAALVLLLLAAVWPRRKTCTGLHCTGCNHH